MHLAAMKCGRVFEERSSGKARNRTYAVGESVCDFLIRDGHADGIPRASSVVCSDDDLVCSRLFCNIREIYEQVH